ncbi:MAG TPA: UDP-2,3-diacylglucosamine diphosphatase [Thiolapillus brandeum]|uniref:UDP-2,3-diacylglucosamine hydrolase n=1 Tax=Thiolapillus brandeum TaxID=1076588 RepID=A0A831K804_9GAMM|nr:UDP-2,3-diacylglucosamine diphosphatase [Thiolapillus brandeum]
MPYILFISDLHLSPATPELLLQFQRFLASDAVRQADALYILGDLFDAWIGDDDPSPFAAQVRDLLREAGAHTRLYFQQGNRDFLLGADFASVANMQLLPEEHVIQIGGQPVLLLHGDQLCTDDKDYQQARKLFRSPQFQAQTLAMSIPERIKKAAEIRQMSGEAKAMKSSEIMDVNQQAVEVMMHKHGVRRLIHGHTHRPATHEFELDGQPAERIVLADWKTEGSFTLQVDAGSGEAQIVAV